MIFCMRYFQRFVSACGRKKGRKECPIFVCASGQGAGIILAARDLNVNQRSGDDLFTKYVSYCQTLLYKEV